MQGEWRDGLAVKPAAEITIDYVNRDPSILPGYRLVMIGNDTKVAIVFFMCFLNIHALCSIYLLLLLFF